MKALALLLLAGCGCTSLPVGNDHALRLEFGDGLCSGTAVGRYTILTAAHCVEGDPLNAVNDVETHATHMVRDGHDHVLITVDRSVGGHRIRLNSPIVGEAVHWTGQPDGMRFVYRKGYIAALDDSGAAVDAQGFYGDSGSGVYNDAGALVGVVSSGKRMAREGGLAMQVIYLYPIHFTADDWQAVR